MTIRFRNDVLVSVAIGDTVIPISLPVCSERERGSVLLRLGELASAGQSETVSTLHTESRRQRRFGRTPLSGYDAESLCQVREYKLTFEHRELFPNALVLTECERDPCGAMPIL